MRSVRADEVNSTTLVVYLSCTVLIAKNTFDNKTTKNKLREKSYLFTNNSEITNKT